LHCVFIMESSPKLAVVLLLCCFVLSEGS